MLLMHSVGQEGTPLPAETSRHVSVSSCRQSVRCFILLQCLKMQLCVSADAHHPHCHVRDSSPTRPPCAQCSRVQHIRFHHASRGCTAEGCPCSLLPGDLLLPSLPVLWCTVYLPFGAQSTCPLVHSLPVLWCTVCLSLGALSMRCWGVKCAEGCSSVLSSQHT